MSRVYITSGKGTLTLDDGRTMQLNGLNNEAGLSDGSSILVGGVGPLDILDLSQVQLVLVPTSGGNTTAGITVVQLQFGVAVPTGFVQVYVDGVPVGSPVALADGAASVFVPSNAFSSIGDYTIKVAYSGDGNYSPSSAAENFHFSGS